jgi:hypothetical protein
MPVPSKTCPVSFSLEVMSTIPGSTLLATAWTFRPPGPSCPLPEVLVRGLGMSFEDTAGELPGPRSAKTAPAPTAAASTATST